MRKKRNECQKRDADCDKNYRFWEFLHFLRNLVILTSHELSDYFVPLSDILMLGHFTDIIVPVFWHFDAWSFCWHFRTLILTFWDNLVIWSHFTKWLGPINIQKNSNFASYEIQKLSWFIRFKKSRTICKGEFVCCYQKFFSIIYKNLIPY